MPVKRRRPRLLLLPTVRRLEGEMGYETRVQQQGCRKEDMVMAMEELSIPRSYQGLYVPYAAYARAQLQIEP